MQKQIVDEQVIVVILPNIPWTHNGSGVTSLICFFFFILLTTGEYRPISHYCYKLGIGIAYNIKLWPYTARTFKNKLYFKIEQNHCVFYNNKGFFF